MRQEVQNTEAMLELGRRIGRAIQPGLTIELVGDIGAGKTTLTKGIAESLGVTDSVQSPTFTISRIYPTNRGVDLVHFDFYRLADPGVIVAEFAESVSDDQSIVVVEWADTVRDTLPAGRLTIQIDYGAHPDVRIVTISAGEGIPSQVLEAIQ